MQQHFTSLSSKHSALGLTHQAHDNFQRYQTGVSQQQIITASTNLISIAIEQQQVTRQNLTFLQLKGKHLKILLRITQLVIPTVFKIPIFVA